MRYSETVVERACDDLGLTLEPGSGGWSRARCPLHDDRTPSLAVHREGAWRCMSGDCGQSSDLADLVARVTGEPVEDVRLRLRRGETGDLSELLVVPDDAPNREVEPLFYERGTVPRYFLRRGLTVETAKRWAVGYDSELQAVVIPVHSAEGALVGLVRRPITGLPRKYLYSGGFEAEENLLGIHLIPPGTPSVALVEGPMDALYLDQAGYPAVAIFGAQLHARQVDLLLQRATSVVLAFDADGAGYAATRKAIALLGERVPVSVLTLPPGRKDVADGCTPEELEAAFREAVPSYLSPFTAVAKRVNKPIAM